MIMRKRGLVAVTLLAAAVAIGAPAAAGATARPSGWVQQNPLTAPDAAVNDNFGTVVISGFGSTAIVGAYDKSFDGHDEVGAVYVYVKNGSAWDFQAELTASDRAEGDAFGASVSTTKDGSTVVVGAPFKTVAGKTDAGAAYVFTRTGTAWTQTVELTGAPSGRGNSFGSTVAINGIATRIAVAAPLRSVAGLRRAGAVFVYKRTGATWSPAATLTESAPQANDYFGWALAGKETQIVASSPFHVNANGSSGVVDGFDDPTGTYVQQTALTAGDGHANDGFGWSLSILGAVMAVGAPDHAVNGTAAGAAYVFTHSDSTGIWTPRAELVAPDGARRDNFGETISVAGTTIVVGDPDHRVGSNAAQGVAYVFTGASSTWTQQAELTASDAGPFTEFGGSVAASDTTVMVGEPQHDVGAASGAGRVDVFESV